MINFAKQLEAAVDQALRDKETKQARIKAGNPASSDHRVRGGATRSDKTQAQYAEVFGDGVTVAVAAAKLGISHVGCLNQVYRYERRNLMHRKPQRDTKKGALIFAWGPKPEGDE